MKSFKEYITEDQNRIFRNDDKSKWGIIDTEINKKIARGGLNQIGIGLLKTFEKKGQDSEYAFVGLTNNEKGLEAVAELKKGEKLVRYMSNRTVLTDMNILCVLNADKGYMKYMDNIDEDPEIEDAVWSKPYKFAYLRVTY